MSRALNMVGLGLLVAMTIPPGTVWAGGFEFPDNGTRSMGRGGAFAVGVDDPTAIYYNPSGLSRLRRPTLLANLNVSVLDYRFERAPVRRFARWCPRDEAGQPITVEDPTAREDGCPLEVPQDGEAFAAVNNEAPPFFAPFLAYGHPVGPVVLGLGFYGPSAYGHRRFPADGPQRYNLIEQDMVLVYSTASVAWEGWDGLVRLGVSLQATTVARIMIVTKSDGHRDTLLLGPRYVQHEDSRWDNEVRVEVSEPLIPTGVLGITVAPFAWLEIGLSYRPSFEVTADGTASIRFSPYFVYGQEGVETEYTDYNRDREAECATAAPDKRYLCSRDPRLTDDGVTLSLEFPAVYRAGIRYVHRAAAGGRQAPILFDVELDVVHETWSVVDDITLSFHGDLEYHPFVKAAQKSTVPLSERPVVLAHDWQDTTSVRLGGEVRLPLGMALRLGGSIESETFPGHTADLLAESLQRWTVSMGASMEVSDDLVVSAGWTHIGHTPKEFNDTAVRSQTPLSECGAPYSNPDSCPFDGQPVGNDIAAGRYEVSVELFSIGATLKL